MCILEIRLNGPICLYIDSYTATPIARRVDVRQVVKIIAESLSQHDRKHVVLTPLSGIKVRKRKKED
jgi:hypothetical protein